MILFLYAPQKSSDMTQLWNENMQDGDKKYKKDVCEKVI